MNFKTEQEVQFSVANEYLKVSQLYILKNTIDSTKELLQFY